MYRQNEQRKSFFLNDSAAIGLAMLVYMFSINGLSLFFYYLVSLMEGGISSFGVTTQTAYQVAEIMGYTISFLLALFLMSRGFSAFSELSSPKRFYILSTVPLFFAVFILQSYIHLFFINLFDSVGIHGVDVSLELPKGGVGLALSVISYVLLPSLLEELLFRGLILGRLRRFGDAFAIVFSSVVFALMHHNMVSMPSIFLMGMLFGFITVRANSLIPAMVMHLLNNLIAVSFTYIEQHKAPELAEEISVILVIAGFVSMLSLAVYWIVSFTRNRRRKSLAAANDASSAMTYGAKKIPKTRYALGVVLSSGWMIAFVIIAVITTIYLEFMSRIMEQFADSWEIFGL